MSFTTWRVVPELLASSELHPRAGSSPSVVTPPVAVPPVLAAPPVPVVLLVLVLVLVDDVVEAVTLSVEFEAPPVDGPVVLVVGDVVAASLEPPAASE